MQNIRENIDKLRASVAAACGRVGRRPEDILIVAVAKGAKPDAVRQAHEAGFRVFGENRVQEAAEKIPALTLEAQWHMVGHLQTNKVRDALSLFTMIQSVDSVRLAGVLHEAALAANRTVDVLLEVNISGEPRKYGFKPEELYGAIDEIAAFGAVRVKGLMGISPLAGDAEAKRASFKKLKGLFGVSKSLKKENVEMKFLSMGMSDDFEIAIEEGSNMIRVGRAIFG